MQSIMMYKGGTKDLQRICDNNNINTFSLYLMNHIQLWAFERWNCKLQQQIYEQEICQLLETFFILLFFLVCAINIHMNLHIPCLYSARSIDKMWYACVVVFRLHSGDFFSANGFLIRDYSMTAQNPNLIWVKWKSASRRGLTAPTARYV